MFKDYFNSEDLNEAIKCVELLPVADKKIINDRFGINLDTLCDIDIKRKRKIPLIIKKIKRMIVDKNYMPRNYKGQNGKNEKVTYIRNSDKELKELNEKNFKYQGKKLRDILNCSDYEFELFYENIDKIGLKEDLIKFFGDDLQGKITYDLVKSQEIYRDFYKLLDKLFLFMSYLNVFRGKTIYNYLDCSYQKLLEVIEKMPQNSKEKRLLQELYGDDYTKILNRGLSLEEYNLLTYTMNELEILLRNNDIKIDNEDEELIRVKTSLQDNLNFKNLLEMVPIEYRVILELLLGTYDGYIYTCESISKILKLNLEKVILKKDEGLLILKNIIEENALILEKNDDIKTVIKALKRVR